MGTATRSVMLDEELVRRAEEFARAHHMTLEAYLDLAGDARATAEALSLHRATMYYRLNRIEEITGARLKTGDDRLALHLGLRLARLSGLR